MSDDRHPLRVVSTDVGLDDALALLFLRHHCSPPVDYIVATGGNVAANLVASNCAYLRDVFGLRAELFAGTDPPDLAGERDAAHVHGRWGLGPHRAPECRLPDFGAFLAALRSTDRPIDLLVLGPATDADLLLAEPDLAPRVHRMLMMGGAFREHDGALGNVTPFAEVHVYMDPGAAWETFALGERVQVVPLDATERRLFTADELTAGVGDDAAGRLVRDMVRFLADAHVQLGCGNGVYMHDIIAAAAWLDLVPVEWRKAQVSEVVAQGERRGMIVWEPEGTRPVSYAAAVDADAFLASWQAVLQARWGQP